MVQSLPSLSLVNSAAEYSIICKLSDFLHSFEFCILHQMLIYETKQRMYFLVKTKKYFYRESGNELLLDTDQTLFNGLVITAE